MLLYLDHSSKGGDFARDVTHTIHVAPAADKFGKPTEVPSEWVDEKGDPLTFTLNFVRGECNTAHSGVPDSVAKYAVARGLAQKSQPLLRARRFG